MALSLLHEETEPQRERVTYVPFGPQAERQASLGPSPQHPAAFPTQQVLGMLMAIAAILGARLALLLAGFGAYMLASAAGTVGSQASLWSLFLFGLFVVIPLVWLSATRKL